ncbi:hypothetical protein PTKIN_Ptkin12aG0112600 [Pterospermum kingtungense]
MIEAKLKELSKEDMKAGVSAKKLTLSLYEESFKVSNVNEEGTLLSQSTKSKGGGALHTQTKDENILTFDGLGLVEVSVGQFVIGPGSLAQPKTWKRRSAVVKSKSQLSNDCGTIDDVSNKKAHEVGTEVIGANKEICKYGCCEDNSTPVVKANSHWPRQRQ